jgi:hypothetical protein
VDKEILQLQCNALTLINLTSGMESRKDPAKNQYQTMIQDSEVEWEHHALEAIYLRNTKKTKERGIKPFRNFQNR